MPPARKNLKEILISRVTGQLCMQWKQFSKGIMLLRLMNILPFSGYVDLLIVFDIVWNREKQNGK